MSVPARSLVFAAAWVAFSACATGGGDPTPSSTTASTPVADAGAAPVASVATGVSTVEQVARGLAVFTDVCAECHYTSELRGTQFQFKWRRRTARDLYLRISGTMPDDAPGSLSDQESVDVVAYILGLNGFPVGKVELTADEEALRAILLASPDGRGE